MIHDFRAVPFHHHIELNWKALVINPLRYSVWYSCRYVRANTPYIQGDHNFSSKTVFVKISKLRPGSVCRVRLRAVYNPASIDRGLVEVLETKPASKFIHVARMCMRIYVVNIILGTCIGISTCCMHKLLLSNAGPSTPQYLMVYNISQSSAIFSWSELESCEWNGHEGKYNVYVDPPRVLKQNRPTPVGVGRSSRAHFKLKNLHPCKEYAVRVVAVNELCMGDVSRPVLFRTLPILAIACTEQFARGDYQVDSGEYLKITVTNVIVNATSASVQWIPPNDSRGQPTDVSILCIFGEEQFHLYLPSSQSVYTVSDMQPFTLVEFSLRGITARGDLGPSTVVSAQTRSEYTYIQVVLGDIYI